MKTFQDRYICRDTNIETREEDKPRHLELGRDQTRLRHHSNTRDMRHRKTQAARHETRHNTSRIRMIEMKQRDDVEMYETETLPGTVNL